MLTNKRQNGNNCFVHILCNAFNRYFIVLLVFISITATSTNVLAENKIGSIENNIKSSLVFSEEEINWLKLNPVIEVGASSDFPPYLIKTPDGHLKGILPDLYNAIGDRLGIKFVIHDFKWPTAIQGIKEEKIDVIAAIDKHVAKKIGLLTTDTFNSPLVTVFSRKENTFDIKKDEDISNLRIAYFKETIILKRYFKEKKIDTIAANSVLDAFKLLLQEKVDIVVAFNHDSYQLLKNLITNIEPIYTFKHLSLEPVAAVRPDMPLLPSLLNKGLSSLGYEEKNRIVTKWSWSPKTLSSAQTIKLTQKEKEWLSKNYTVRARISNSPPFEIINGQESGISIDYIKLISERTGIKLKFIPENRPFNEALWDVINNKSIDLLLSAGENVTRKDQLLFSEDYFSSPYVIYTLNNNNHIHGIEDLYGKSVAIVKGSHLSEELETQYPFINLQLYDTTEKAIENLAFGNADAFIGNLTQGSFLLSSLGLSNLKVASPIPMKNHIFSYATRKDWPELNSIINKGLQTITPSERSKIRKKYISVLYENNENPVFLKWLMIISLSAMGIIFLFLVWNRQLSREISRRKKAEEDLKTTNQRLALAIEVASVGIWDWDIKQEIGTWNDKMFEIYQLPKQKLMNFDSWAQTLHPEDFKKTVNFFESSVKSEFPDIIDYRIITPDSSIRHIHSAVMPIKDEEGHISTMFGVNIDISDQKEIEARLEQRVAKRTKDLELEILERQRATNALAQNEEKYRWMIDSAIVGVFTTSVEGDLLFVNDAFAKMYEFDTQEEMKQEGILPRWANLEQREEMLTELRLHGVVNNFESEMVTRTGRHIHVMFSSILQGDTTSGMSVDITDRKKAEIALIESEEKFLAIFEQTAIGLCQVSLKGQFIQVNQKFCDLTGYNEEELCNLTVEDITFAEDFDTHRRLSQELIEGTKNSFNMRKRLLKKDGTLLWIHLTATLIRDENSGPLYFLGAIADIDTRKKTEEALEQSNERFRMVFDNAPVLIEAFNVEGRWTMWNKECERRFGWTEKEMLSHKNPIELFYPDPKEQKQVMETIMSTPDNVFKEWYPRRKDGEIVTCSWANYKLNDGNIISLGYDITESKITEKKIQEYQQRLKSLAAQLTLVEERERRRIAADLHDNVGQSLALTRLQLATARKNLPENSKQDIIFKDISATLLKTIQDTRHLIFELSSPFLNELGLGSAINEWMKEQISDQHEIKFKLIDHSKDLILDNDLRAILFRNIRELLINAIKHSNATNINVWLEYENNLFRISVEDNGIGFDPSIVHQNDGVNKCFGLFSVQERMNDLDGRIKISSQSGTGSMFVLYLPINT